MFHIILIVFCINDFLQPVVQVSWGMSAAELRPWIRDENKTYDALFFQQSNLMSKRKIRSSASLRDFEMGGGGGAKEERSCCREFLRMLGAVGNMGVFWVCWELSLWSQCYRSIVDVIVFSPGWNLLEISPYGSILLWCWGGGGERKLSNCTLLLPLWYSMDLMCALTGASSELSYDFKSKNW